MHAPVLRPEAFYLPEVETRFIPAGTALTVDLSKTCRVLYVEDAFDQARLLVQDKEWDLNELRPDTAYLPIEDDRDPSRVESASPWGPTESTFDHAWHRRVRAIGVAFASSPRSKHSSRHERLYD